LLLGDIAQARQGFRELLTTPILFRPFVENGRRGIRFEGKIGLAGILGGEVVTKLASPSIPSWNQILSFLQEMAKLRDIAASAA
jgi:hypothetical protein